MLVDKIKPLGNRVLIKRLEALQKKGGILLPETAKEKPKEGDVLSIGPGKRDEEGNLQPMKVKVGDRVLFSSYSGTEVKTDQANAEYLILSEDDILGIIS